MKRKIPLVDLNLQYQTIKSEIDEAINRVLAKGQFILGKEVEQFEKEFARFCGVKYGVGLDNGLSSLELGMRALGIGSGDEVITPANSFVASSSAILFTGARPVLVDCEERTFNIDPLKIEQKITKKTKAIMPVHLFGRPANMNAILDLAGRHKLLIVEDACQAHGAETRVKGKGLRVKAGSIGAFGAFSFYPAKNLGAYGDAGMLVTDDRRLAETVREMRNYGQVKKYQHTHLSWNRRLDTIQAAILLVKLKHLKKWNNLRRKIAQKYNLLLKNLPLIPPEISDQLFSVFHQYVIRTKKRDELALYLDENGISTGIHYPTPIHLQKAFKQLGYKRGDFPVTESLASEILSLPIFPELSDEQVKYISHQIRKFFSQN